jgi:hypothetical protein
MSGAHHTGPQAAWAPDAARMKLPAGPTVNLSAVAATLGGGGGAPAAAYSSASSPFARGSSTHSSPFISRTASGCSEGSAGATGSHQHQQEGGGRAALSRQGSQAVAGSPGGSRSGSPHGGGPALGTRSDAPARSNLGPAAMPEPVPLEAKLQGECGGRAIVVGRWMGWVGLGSGRFHLGRLLGCCTCCLLLLDGLCLP